MRDERIHRVTKRNPDLTGLVFARLTVRFRNGSRNGHRALWLCECACGNTRVVSGTDLKTGRVKSCGCLKRKRNGIYSRNNTRECPNCGKPMRRQSRLCKTCWITTNHRNKNDVLLRRREQSRRYRQEHADSFKAAQAKWREKNRERERERARLYRKQNPQCVKETARRYNLAHPEKAIDRCSKRRARQTLATVESVQRVVVYERDGGKCHLCGKRVNRKHWHLDHIVPLSQGGCHSYQNVAVACPACNQRKYNKMSQNQLRLF